MRLFLIGPRPDSHQIAYTEMAERLRADGHQVIDPSTYTASRDMPPKDCRRADLEELLTGEAVQLLPGWQAWPPSVLAHDIAQFIGVPIWPVKLHDPALGCRGARDDAGQSCDCCRECQRPKTFEIQPEAVRVGDGYECGQRVFHGGSVPANEGVRRPAGLGGSEPQECVAVACGGALTGGVAA